jgi:hypothetical protein
MSLIKIAPVIFGLLRLCFNNFVLLNVSKYFNIFSHVYIPEVYGYAQVFLLKCLRVAHIFLIQRISSENDSISNTDEYNSDIMIVSERKRS